MKCRAGANKANTASNIIRIRKIFAYNIVVYSYAKIRY